MNDLRQTKYRPGRLSKMNKIMKEIMVSPSEFIFCQSSDSVRSMKSTVCTSNKKDMNDLRQTKYRPGPLSKMKKIMKEIMVSSSEFIFCQSSDTVRSMKSTVCTSNRL
jgi:tryptophan synthase alpha subunit